MDSGPLLDLLHLSDLSLPIGAYAHSYGMETYVQRGLIHDQKTAHAFIAAMLNTTIRYTDAALVSLAHQAPDREELLRLDALCGAVKIPSETRAASERMGSRLATIFGHPGGALVHYPVAFGSIAAARFISRADALTGFLYNAAAGMVTNAVKLVPLGQQQGQQMLFELQPLIASVSASALVPDPSLIGVSCAGFDIRCMQHEVLYSRLFMS